MKTCTPAFLLQMQDQKEKMLLKQKNMNNKNLGQCSCIINNQAKRRMFIPLLYVTSHFLNEETIRNNGLPLHGRDNNPNADIFQWIKSIGQV